jgi:translation initiation factor IF-1
VSGTVQSTSSGRVLFKTKDGLTVPVDTSQIRGLPALAANTPATLIYEQGANQESQPVWIEAGDTTTASSQPSASLPSANAPTGQKLEGLVESIAAAEITVQTTDGRHIKVDTANVDRTTLASVRPGDIVTVTGTAGTDPDKFSATTVTKTK